MADTLIAVLLDANIVLHFPPPDQINWCELTGRKEVVLVIYPLLLHEVSDAKDMARSRTVRRRAADRVRWFYERLGDLGNEVRPGVRIKTVYQEPAVDFEDIGWTARYPMTASLRRQSSTAKLQGTRLPLLPVI